MKLIRNLFVLALGVLSLSATSALAGTANGTLTVSALVTNTCTIGNATLDFGTYSTTLGALKTTTVDVTCSLLAPYSLTMGQGQNYASGSNRMKASVAGTDRFIPYTATFVGAVAGALPGVGTGLDIPASIAGVAPAGANVPAGSYSDSVVLTVSF